MTGKTVWTWRGKSLGEMTQEEIDDCIEGLISERNRWRRHAEEEVARQRMSAERANYQAKVAAFDGIRKMFRSLVPF